MINLNEGKLRERVKSGELSAKDVRQALLKLQSTGEVVSVAMLRWLNRR